MRTRYDGGMTATLVDHRLTIAFDDLDETREWQVPPLIRGSFVHALRRPNRPELLHAALDKLEYGS